MWKFTGDLARSLQLCAICQIIQLRLGSSRKFLYISEMASFVRLAVCSQAYVSSHATSKSNYVDQMSYKSTTDLVNMTRE